MVNTSNGEYTGSNENGHSIQLSGNKSAVSPMESILMAMAGCSAVDVEIILEKTRQKLEKLEIIVEGKRDKTAVPAVFTEVHLHYKLKGNIKDKKAEQAVSMAIDKYCSVIRMLEKSVKVSYGWEVLQE